MAKSKIPDSLKSDLLKRSAAGATGDQLVAWLKSTHQIEVTREGVQKRIRQWSGEHAEVATAIVREALSTQLPETLKGFGVEIEKLNAIDQRLDKIAEQAANNPKAVGINLRIEELKAENAERRARILEKELKFAGVDSGDEGLGDALSKILNS